MNANELADEIDVFLKEGEQLPWGTKQVYLDLASFMLRQQQTEIEEWKRRYKDMHNLATQAMSRNHQLEKKPVKTYTEGIPNYVTENNDKQHNPINNIEPSSSNSCGR